MSARGSHRRRGERLTDKEAMEKIQRIMSAEEWGSDTTEEIAQVVKATGRTVEDLT